MSLVDGQSFFFFHINCSQRKKNQPTTASPSKEQDKKSRTPVKVTGKKGGASTSPATRSSKKTAPEKQPAAPSTAQKKTPAKQPASPFTAAKKTPAKKATSKKAPKKKSAGKKKGKTPQKRAPPAYISPRKLAENVGDAWMTIQIPQKDFDNHYSKRYVPDIEYFFSRTLTGLRNIYVIYGIYLFCFSAYYLVDTDGEMPRVMWQPSTERYVPPRVGQGDTRVKYTGNEDPNEMSPKSREKFFSALRMRRMALRQTAKEQE